MTKRGKKIEVLILVFLLLLSVMFMAIGSGIGGIRAAAASNTYSNVLTDLCRDENFKTSDYPYKSGDYSLQVIQIAESDKGELFVYVYQSCGVSEGLCATEINMSLSESADGTKLYGLTLLNASGVFAKYKVKDVTVNAEGTRYYNITSIYRAWKEGVDAGTGNSNRKDFISYPVGKVFKTTTENGKIQYSVLPTYTVKILNPYYSSLAFSHGDGMLGYFPTTLFWERFLSFKSSDFVDSHFICFSTDWNIDRLISATVTYMYSSARAYSDEWLGIDFGKGVEYGEEAQGYADLKYTEKVDSYEWNRIQTTDELLAELQAEGVLPYLSNELKVALSSTRWVLSFLETDRRFSENNILGYQGKVIEFTRVEKVSILRLEFETDGVCYNLGAVSDTVSGKEFNVDDAFGSDDAGFWEKLWDAISDFFTGKSSWWVYLVVGLVILAIGLPILSLVVPAVGNVVIIILKAIGKALVWILKSLWWLICLPFKGIAALIKKIQDKKGGA